MPEFNDLTKVPCTCKKLGVKLCFFIVLLISQAVLVILGLYIYDTHYKKSVGVVNITGIAEEFIKSQTQSSRPQEETKKIVREFGASLEKTLHDVGRKNKTILMPAEAVITGAKDYTQEVRKRLPTAPKLSVSTFAPVAAPQPNNSQLQDSLKGSLEEFADKARQLDEEIKGQRDTQMNQGAPLQPSVGSTEQHVIEQPGATQMSQTNTEKQGAIQQAQPETTVSGQENQNRQASP